MRCERIWRDARLATMAPASTPDDPLGIVEDGIVAMADGRILYAGSAADAPRLDAGETIPCHGRWITPGLIDCHTHLVYAGSRASEFEQRLAGASYEEIARAGGGIASTVTATRAASAEALLSASLARLDAMLADGVTTVEVKSGYGLTLETEARMLRVARSLEQERAVRVSTTFLGAHAVPPEWRDDPDRYVDEVVERMIPVVAEERLADAVDAFCEGIGFSPAQVERVFKAARQAGLSVKLHAEQLSNLQGAQLAARYRALSADHLEHADTASLDAMAEAGTVAVLLPGAFYFTRETKRPPIQAIRDTGIAMAVATDCNPGTSPMVSLLLAMNMAATLFQLTVPECLIGVTRNAARALGLQDQIGTLEPGKACDLAIWDVEHPAELVYAIGGRPLHARIFGGFHA
ncbi:imidazolonepropionase [Altererythrobacter sp. B11]|uniref:imidazolonepropionase n=1 Tax=Altererythrobacter sp. B11 TaxID=2060312 RepID=UPI000DC728DF|nr:imidazolonepropionase [Altererythrobacter sp. B11]BBC73391.1 imidazolonepropionase [Altererythrobacter sp. B11]